MQTTRIAPLSPTLARMLDAAERDLDAAYEATQVAYEAGSAFARARWDAHPHPQFSAWGNGWTRAWEPGEYEARAAEMLAAFDAAHEADARAVAEAADAAGITYARASAYYVALTGDAS
jgi:hypothetical protein